MGSPHEAANDGVSPSGKAAGFESAMRWFESSHPRENVSPYSLRADVFFKDEDENQRSWRPQDAGGGNAATGCRGGVPVRIQPPQKTLPVKAKALPALAAQEVGHEFDAAVQAELAQDRHDVLMRRARSEEELPRDFTLRHPGE